jgi:hypothetical protein
VPIGTPSHVERLVGAVGWGGQRLYVVPGLDLVVAMNAGNYRRPGREQGRIANTLITELVLPAVV